MILHSIRQTVATFIYPEMDRERRDLERLANIDELTGLANRRAFDLAAPAAERDPGTAVVLFDANNFGKLNKIAGHKFGDEALTGMAETIFKVAKVYGSAARTFRIGGDEFVVLIGKRFAAQFRDQTERLYGVKYPGINVSLSGTIGDTFAEADSKLQQRKREQKNGQSI